VGANKPTWVTGLPILGSVWLTGAIVDRLWFAVDRSIPGWDQADYLTGAMNYWRVFQNPDWFSQDWWTGVWMLSSKMPPLVYISTTPFLSLFGAGIEQSTLVNLFYSAILLAAVYGLGLRLFTLEVGLWASGLCLLLPGLYKIRLDFLIDYPLVAMVTLSFWLLTLLVVEVETEGLNFSSFAKLLNPSDRPPIIPVARFFLLPIGFGIALGLTFLTKQPAIFFLLVPIVAFCFVILRDRNWTKLIQLFLGLLVATTVCLPWYRTNWLLILTAGKRATVDSAIAEGDPPLTTLAAWTFYLKEIPTLVSLPIFVVGLVGLVLYWKRSVVVGHWFWANRRLQRISDYGGLRARGYRQKTHRSWWHSVRWLLIFLIGAYLLCSLNVNKDDRYITPLLPVLTILLAQGLVLFPDRLRAFRWGAVGLSVMLMLLNLLPSNVAPKLSGSNQHPASLGGEWHHAQVIDEVIRAVPYLRSTIGVLPSTVELNQHNLNYYGALRNFQVYGRQVGTRLKQVAQEARSLSWLVTKSGNQGAIRQPEAQTSLGSAIAQSSEFQLQKTWSLPDDSVMKLYRRRVPLVQVMPSDLSELSPRGRGCTWGCGSVRLEQVRVPNQAAPGKPMPVTYRWSGSWEQLRSGLVLLTWRAEKQKLNPQAARWLHDHAIALGTLQPESADKKAQFQVIERTATLPPAAAQGSYTLEATYLNRETGETYNILVPPVKVQIADTAPEIPDVELDWVTQLRSLSTNLPKGLNALDPIFEQVGRINQFDPIQDYVTQAKQTLEFRLKQEPQNLEFFYALALANVLKRQLGGAIDTFEQVTRLDANNPNAYAYLAFVNLYDFRPQAAQSALKTAFSLDPDLPELHALNAVAALMQGNVGQAWQEFESFQKGD
jgi:4-amino-4-deoxy-L-arabinose transferase-like glycosyltransferase